MRDIVFSYAMAVLTAVTFGLYGGRLLIRGRARSGRADQDGGSVFVSKGFMEFGYWLVEPFVGALYRAGATPNQVTLFSLLPALGAGVAAGQGRFGLASLCGTVASLCDAVDGMLARRRGSASDAGEAFDAIADRYVEFFFLGGLIVYYRFSMTVFLLAIAALFGAFMISYSTAKAEALRVAPPRGAMRRAERAIYLFFGAGLTPLMTAAVGVASPLAIRQAPMLLAVALIAVVANISAVQRTRAIIAAVRARDLAEAASSPSSSLAAPPPSPASAPHLLAPGDVGKSRSVV